MRASDKTRMKASVTVWSAISCLLLLSVQVFLPSLFSCPLYKHQIQLLPSILGGFQLFFAVEVFFFVFLHFRTTSSFHLTQGEWELRGAQEEHVSHLSARIEHNTHAHAHICAATLAVSLTRKVLEDRLWSPMVSNPMTVVFCRVTQTSKCHSPPTPLLGAQDWKEWGAGMQDSRRPSDNSWSYICPIADSRFQSRISSWNAICTKSPIQKKSGHGRHGGNSPWICAIAPLCAPQSGSLVGGHQAARWSEPVGRISFPQRVCLDAAPSENARGL